MKNLDNIHRIKCFIFDYDGVISDGGVFMLPTGEGVRRSNVKDGYALHYAVKSGYIVSVISRGTSDNMRVRMKSLGVENVMLGVSYKLDKFEDFLIENDLQAEEVLYMGDDIPDYEVVKAAGIGACPADACYEIKSIADYISPFKGGNGAVRDVIEQVMKIQDKWISDSAFHW